jgi:tetratricopeptide (TPR) repeat protein
LSGHTLTTVHQQNQTQSDELSLERYRTLIHRYRDGDFRWTVEELNEISLGTVQYLSDQLPKLSVEQNQLSPELTLSEKDLQAAVLLHTQVALWKSNERDAMMLDAHWEAAQNICDHVSDADFRRRWLLTRGYFYQTRLEEKPAVAVLELALKEFPKDSDLLLSLGTVYESVGEFLGRWAPTPLPTWPMSTDQEIALWKRRYFERGSRKRLERAEKHYMEALEARPDFDEARLRLGRVQYHLGEGDEALRNFDWVIDRSKEPRRVGLAHLFAGKIYEQGENMKESLKHYRAAVETRKDWQLAYIAMSSALHRTGDLAASREILMKALQLPIDPRNPQGGLWDYSVMNDVVEELVLRLRSGVVR